MIIPTFLILPPAMVAMLLYLWMYFERNPENRVTDLRFLLAIGCFGVVAGYMFVMIRQYDRTVPSMVFFAMTLGLLITAIQMMRLRPAKASRYMR